VHPDDREATSERLAQLRGGSAIEYFENRFATRGGGWRWLGWTAAPFAEEGLVYIFARDLTERRIAEEERVKLIREQTARAAAEASERRAAFLAEATAAMTESLDFDEILGRLAETAMPALGDWCLVDVVDEEGGVQRVAVAHADPAQREVAEGLRAYAPDVQAPGPHASALKSGEPLLLAEVDDAVRDRFARDPEHRRLLARMAARSALIVPLMARERCLALMTLATAASERRYTREDQELAQEVGRRAALALDNARLYRASQEARRASEKANRAKDEFLATLSHELRTPLTPILGWTVMLRSGSLDQQAIMRGLEVIERNVRAQTQLIGDLLDVSRIITGKLRLEVRHIELAPVVEAGIDAVRTSADAKEIALHVDLEAGLPAISGDPDRLQQVVWNLVSNAVKFTPNSGHIDVTLRRRDGHVELRVADSGKGISPDFLPFVFDRFRQADSTSTRAHGGLGLGLAIVRHLVELHGGTVVAESEGEGKGATFVVRLPLSPAAAAPTAGTGTEALEDAGPRLDGVRVFVVDAEKDMRAFLSDSLEQRGADVTSFESTTDALAALESGPPHVLVSDTDLAGEDGFQFIRRVRALSPERGGQTPAAALTVPSNGDENTRALSAGFQVHLPKPVVAGDLVQAVATLAGRPAAAGD
jgi:signal transduction histidine kinase/ActR/RegA family two-component response regulator